MGNALKLVNDFKIDTAILNCGEYNSLEKELISILSKKRLTYYSCINSLRIGKHDLNFLNTKIYDNENGNSSVIYFRYLHSTFLFMGDVSIAREADILNMYDLGKIDFLKVGHHGSDTSSSEKFIHTIQPKYTLVSVGKNNKYGHPKESVLKKLKNSKIYRTDLDGSVEIILNKNGFKLKTYSS